MSMTIDREVMRRESLTFDGQTVVKIPRVSQIELTPVENDEDADNFPENLNCSLTIRTQDGDVVELWLTADDPKALEVKPQEV